MCFSLLTSINAFCVNTRHELHRERRGLKVDDDTKDMMKEVEREITVTKACSHPHVVSILGLMVGPGRIGIHYNIYVYILAYIYIYIYIYVYTYKTCLIFLIHKQMPCTWTPHIALLWHRYCDGILRHLACQTNPRSGGHASAQPLGRICSLFNGRRRRFV